MPNNSSKPGKVPESGLSWNYEWLHDTESIYGIACKLATANELVIPEALDYLSLDATTAVQAAYRTWASFDARVLAKRLGLPRGRVQKALPNWSLRGGIAVDDDYYRALRFCPHCLATGFHSMTHQSRVVNRCPAHGCPLLGGCPHCYELINPFVGNPWHCSACDRPLAEFRGFDWLERFKQAPECEEGMGWDVASAALQARRPQWTCVSEKPLRTESYECVRILAEHAKLFVDDVEYWQRNARKLGFWYFHEQQAMMRSVLPSHLDCTLRNYIENGLHGVDGQCVAANGQQIAAELIWQTGAALVWPAFNRDTLRNIELHLVRHLFHRPSGRYLADGPAEMVVRALTRSFVATAVLASTKGLDRYRFTKWSTSVELCTAHDVEWTADDAEFVLKTPPSDYINPRLNFLADAHCALWFIPKIR